MLRRILRNMMDAFACCTAIVIIVGPGGVYDQMIRFRMASRQVEGWSLKENWAAISGEIADEQLVVPAAAGSRRA